MKVRIEIEPQAITRLEELDAWWREERPESRTSVLEEFDNALDVLRDQSDRGVRYEDGGLHNVRWLRLHGTPYKLYYHHEPGAELLSVVSVWNGKRGVGPDISRC